MAADRVTILTDRAWRAGLLDFTRADRYDPFWLWQRRRAIDLMLAETALELKRLRWQRSATWLLAAALFEAAGGSNFSDIKRQLLERSEQLEDALAPWLAVERPQQERDEAKRLQANWEQAFGVQLADPAVQQQLQRMAAVMDQQYNEAPRETMTDTPFARRHAAD